MRSRFLTSIDCTRTPAEAAGRWIKSSYLKIEHLQDSESFVFRVTDAAGCARYLRLTHDGHRPAEQIRAELEFVEYLAGAGIPVARPQRSLAGGLSETVASSDSLIHACMFEAAPGNRLEFRTPNWNAESFRRWGAALGALHNASAGFATPGHRRFRWDEDDVWAMAAQYLPASDTAARREWQRLEKWLSARSQSSDEFGMIHGDLCAANFHVSPDTVTAFDFDDSCYHWFIYDIVCTVAPATFRPKEERHALRSAILEGYLQVRNLPADWESAFNEFLRMRGLYLFSLNHRNWDGDLSVHPKRRLLDLLRESFDHPPEW